MRRRSSSLDFLGKKRRKLKLATGKEKKSNRTRGNSFTKVGGKKGKDTVPGVSSEKKRGNFWF